MSEFLFETLTSEETVVVQDKLNIVSTQFKSLMKICITYMLRIEGIISTDSTSTEDVSRHVCFSSAYETELVYIEPRH